MGVRRCGLAVAVLLGSGLGGVTPAVADPGATIISITTNVFACTSDVTFRVQDAGDYFVNMWDDGNYRAGAVEAVLVVRSAMISGRCESAPLVSDITFAVYCFALSALPALAAALAAPT